MSISRAFRPRCDDGLFGRCVFRIRKMTFVRPLVVAGFLSIQATALAAPPEGADPNSSMGQWYRSLMQPNSNASCCGLGDCRPVEARLTPVGWEIKLSLIVGQLRKESGELDPVMADKWISVPNDKVLKRENLDGRPIACVGGGDDPGIPPSIHCFIPPSGT
jgi:hypothetical protein